MTRSPRTILLLSVGLAFVMQCPSGCKKADVSVVIPTVTVDTPLEQEVGAADELSRRVERHLARENDQPAPRRDIDYLGVAPRGRELRRRGEGRLPLPGERSGAAAEEQEREDATLEEVHFGS